MPLAKHKRPYEPRLRDQIETCLAGVPASGVGTWARLAARLLRACANEIDRLAAENAALRGEIDALRAREVDVARVIGALGEDRAALPRLVREKLTAAEAALRVAQPVIDAAKEWRVLYVTLASGGHGYIQACVRLDLAVRGYEVALPPAPGGER